MSINLKQISEKAMVEGQKIDLSECYYGEPHWDGPFVNKPSQYYYFLAGFVRIQKILSILEIGTHFGGSIKAMSEGLPKENIKNSNLVTVDITYKNENGFRSFPHIRRIQGDSLNEETINKVVKSFKPPIDLIYIDAVHNYEHTKKNIDIYGNKLNPKYIILDDIHLNESMQKLWNEICNKFKNRVFDASEISKRGKLNGLSGTAGFGLIQWK